MARMGTKSVAAQLVLLASAVTAGVISPFFYSGVHNPVAPHFYYVSSTPMVAMPMTDLPRDGEVLPCTSAGFFPHPTDCSRFYRCVDYLGTGQHFSVFNFQCPANSLFVGVLNGTCVPGPCEGSAVAPAPAGSGGDGSYPGASVTGPVAAPVGAGSVAVPPTSGGAYPQPGGAGVIPQPPPTPGPVAYPGDQGAAGGVPTPAPIPPPVAPVNVGGAYPQPGAGAPVIPQADPGIVDPGMVPVEEVGAGAGAAAAGAGDAGAGAGDAGAGAGAAGAGAGAAGAGTGAAGAGTGAAGAGAGAAGAGAGAAGAGAGAGYPGAGGAGDGCPARYVQHKDYCNMYVPCPDDGSQYICVIIGNQELVFDQARQMCTYKTEEDVCNGKPMMKSLTFRADTPIIVQPGTLSLLSVPFSATPSFYSSPVVPHFTRAGTPVRKTVSIQSSGHNDLGTLFFRHQPAVNPFFQG